MDVDVTAETVLNKVRAGGGSLVLEADADVLAVWRHAAKVAKLRLLRAGSQRLRSVSSPGKLMLRLVDVDDDSNEIRPPAAPYAEPPRPRPRTDEFRGRTVPVPSAVTKPHSIVEQLTVALERPERLRYLDRPYLIRQKRHPKQRMRQIWQAIVAEAEFRGYSTSFRLEGRDHYSRGELVLSIDRDQFPIDLYGDRETPLRLMINERHPSRRRGYVTWTDSPDNPLSKRLGEVFAFIEQWADVLLAQRERERQQELERRKRMQDQEEQARRSFAEQFRRDAIASRVAEVGFAQDARGYARALLASAEQLEGAQRADAEEWAAWIVRYADSVDPILNKLGMPEAREPVRDELREFLPPGHYLY